MRVILMVTADYAAVEPSTGKLNVLGVFNRIIAREFPVSHPRMYFALKFESDSLVRSVGHRLQFELVDEDGKHLFALEGHFEMSESPPGIPSQAGIVFELNHINFPSPGDYRLQVAVDGGEIEESMVLQVVEDAG